MGTSSWNNEIMQISHLTKFKLREMGGILIFFILLGIIGVLVSLRSNDFPVGRGMAAIIIMGLLTALHEIVIAPRVSKYNFAINFIEATVYYYFSFSIVIVFMGYATQVYKHNMSWGEAFQVDYYQIFPEGIGQEMLMLGMAIFILIIIRFSNQMLGHGVLIKYLSGRYHRPRNEKRIFMFLDLKSSTEIAEKLGHQKYSSFLKDFFNKLDEAILATKGYLFQYVGDEIVMIWSYRKGFKNNNILKFYELINEVLENSKEEFFENYGIVPEYKAGIHCGIVSITEIGSIRRSIAYHGDPINTASRVCAKCKELDEDILISQDIYDNLQSRNNTKFEYLGEFELKGKKNKLGLYSIN